MDLKSISPEELKKRMQDKKGLIILDVRAEDKYEKDHIEGSCIQSINIPKTIIFDSVNGETNLDSFMNLPKGQEIIVTCTTGNSAKKCATILKDKEYDVTVLEGGITAWRVLGE
ncbi:MAG: rhodanese-like domain-containing protein [Bacillus sp. (in: firmicutes)]